MLETLKQNFLSPNDTSFYDMKAKSHQELLANFHAKLNECVEEINAFTDSITNKYDEFLKADETAKQEHMSAIRQEFQDFINVIDLKVLEINNHISDQDKDISDAVNYMVTNLRANVSSIIYEMRETGTLNEDILNGLDDLKTELENKIATVESIAKGKNRARVFPTTEDMYSALSNVENKGKWNVGDNLYIVDIDVPDWWISEVLEEPDSEGRYYSIAQLETQKVDLTEYDNAINEINSNLDSIFKTYTTSTVLLFRQTEQVGYLALNNVVPDGYTLLSIRATTNYDHVDIVNVGSYNGKNVGFTYRTTRDGEGGVELETFFYFTFVKNSLF